MNQTLEAMARALFKSWFVDFDSMPRKEYAGIGLGLIRSGVVSVGELIDFNPTEPMRKGRLHLTLTWLHYRLLVLARSAYFA